MALPLNKALVSPVLVGRTPYVDLLERVIHDVRSQQGQTVLLAGEAGIGKSRLVKEARTHAERQGFLVVQGNCFEPDRALPFAPLLDLLRPLLASHSDEQIADYWEPSGGDLLKIVPELASRIPELASNSPLDPEQEKRRLFGALARFFGHMASVQPLMIVIEDLHWADDTSLEFILHLARQIARKPILLLITFRSDESQHLSPFLATLDRERLASEMQLVHLGASDVETMVRAIFELKRPVRGEFLNVLCRLTEGNPFFIEETLKSLVLSGGIPHIDDEWDRKSIADLRVPRSIQATVRQRLEQISLEAREILLLASVAGQRFDFDLLQTLTKHDEQTLLKLIKELIGAQLVIEISAAQFTFRHALTRQAIYTSLLARERKVLHKNWAEIIEQTHGPSSDAYLADLAYHYHEAEAWEKALEYGKRAGEMAQALYSPGAAVEHFSRAVAAADRLDVPVPTGLYNARGLAYESLGDFKSAQADYEAVLEMARAGGERMTEWKALLDLGLLWASRDYTQTGNYYTQGMELAREIGDANTLAHTLNRLGNWHLNMEEPVPAEEYHQEALIIFQKSNVVHGIAETLDYLGMTSFLKGDMIKSAGYYEQAIELFRELGNRQSLAVSMIGLSFPGAKYQVETMAAPASVGKSAHYAMEAFQLVSDIGHRSDQAYALLGASSSLGPMGDYTRALELARSGLQIAEEIEHRQWAASLHCTLGNIYSDLLAFDKARPHLEAALAASKEINSLHWIRISAAGLANACLAQGEPEVAEAILTDVLPPETPAQTIGQRLAWCAIADLTLARGNPMRALEICNYLTSYALNLDKGRAILRLSQLRGNALLVLGRAEEALHEFSQALEVALKQGVPPYQWRLHMALGRANTLLGRPEEAGRQFSKGRKIIEELAANVIDQALRETFVQRAISSLPGAQSASKHHSAAKSQTTRLTPREYEVAALVAQGKSNRYIADILIVGERTVETHVGNILSKLGFTSRAQIAAWSVREGLPKQS